MVQQSMVLVDAAGRRRSPASMPGYLARVVRRATRACSIRRTRRAPRRSFWSCVRPATIVTVCGSEALIAVLWRGGLRISEALALSETDLDERRGSLLVRHGKGDKRRREAGMDAFGFEQVAAWMARRIALPPGPLLCVIDGATRGRRWSATAARAELRQLAVDAGARRRFAPHQLRHAHAVELAREGVAVNVIQRQHTDLGDDLRVSARRRSRARSSTPCACAASQPSQPPQSLQALSRSTRCRPLLTGRASRVAVRLLLCLPGAPDPAANRRTLPRRLCRSEVMSSRSLLALGFHSVASALPPLCASSIESVGAYARGAREVCIRRRAAALLSAL